MGFPPPQAASSAMKATIDKAGPLKPKLTAQNRTKTETTKLSSQAPRAFFLAIEKMAIKKKNGGSCGHRSTLRKFKESVFPSRSYPRRK